MNQTSLSIPNGERVRFDVVCSSWHADIVHRARDAALAEFERNGVAAERIEVFDVPGAFEIPLWTKKLVRSRRYDAVIAIGLIVDGGIYRHEFVSTAVINALMRIQLDSEVPVLSAVLTPRAFHDHEDHVRFFSEHFVKKGIEVARACLQAVVLHQELQVGTAA